MPSRRAAVNLQKILHRVGARTYVGGHSRRPPAWVQSRGRWLRSSHCAPPRVGVCAGLCLSRSRERGQKSPLPERARAASRGQPPAPPLSATGRQRAGPDTGATTRSMLFTLPDLAVISWLGSARAGARASAGISSSAHSHTHSLMAPSSLLARARMHLSAETSSAHTHLPANCHPRRICTRTSRGRASSRPKIPPSPRNRTRFAAQAAPSTSSHRKSRRSQRDGRDRSIPLRRSASEAARMRARHAARASGEGATAGQMRAPALQRTPRRSRAAASLAASRGRAARRVAALT